LTDIQEPDCYAADMTEKELREKVSHERTEYGIFNADYVHTQDSTEDFVSIGEMGDEGNDPSSDYPDIVIDNSWNVLNNQILQNSLSYDPTVSDKINSIAGVNAQTSQSNITARKISIAKDEIQAKKFFSFTEANDAKIDTSAFSINHSIALDQRFYFITNLLDQGFSSLYREIDFGPIPNIGYHFKET
jgi:hypothetical protein